MIRSLRILAGMGFVLLYLPLAALVWGSFRGSSGFTGQWYRKAFADPALLDAFRLSLEVGLSSTLLATILGTLGALALERSRFRGRRIFELMTHVPLVMPEIVMALSLLIWFVCLRITLGAVSIVLAHTTFCLSYVVLTVSARLKDFDSSLEEAAQDLGAPPAQVFWRITFPLILPGILSAALMSFTLSFDDFLVTFFTAGAGYDTLPLKVYAMVKFGVSPEVNAVSTLMLTATALAALGSRLATRRQA